MLTIKEGNLFANLKPPCVIVHGCNCQGKMGRGFAGQLRKRFPDAYRVYLKARDAHGLTLGDINGYSDTDKYTIINALTQEFYGTDDTVYVSYEAVQKSMGTVARWVLSNGGGPDYPVHLPFIGAGNANGDKRKLLEILKEAFKEANATLWLDSETAQWARNEGEME